MHISFLKNRFSSALFAFILIGFSVLVIYSNIYDSPFVFDDDRAIVEKKTIRNLSNYFSSDRLLEPRMLVDLSFALNYKFGKLDVFGYHLVNVGIHIVNGFLIYFLALAILGHLYQFSDSFKVSISDPSDHTLRIISLGSALIFVVHPIQTQAVTYTAQRYTSMAAMFYMASILFYLKARITVQRSDLKPLNPSSFAYYVLSGFCGLSAFLCKQNAASLPGAVLLIEYLLIDRTWQGWKKKIKWFAPFIAVWVFFILYVSGLFGGEFESAGLLEDVSGLMRETQAVSRWSYLCTQFNVLVIYIRLLFLPINQNLDYLYPIKESFFNDFTFLAFLFLVGLVVTGIRSIKKHPIISFAIFWFFITLSVESSIFPIEDALFEHRLYLPMFGFALFAVYVPFTYLSNKRHWAIVCFMALTIALAIATYYRNSVWKDGIALWSDVVAKSPQNYRGHNNLGSALEKQGRIKEAIEHYLKALQIRPEYAKAYHNLGNAYVKQGRTQEAIKHYLKALRIKPALSKTHINLGNALNRQGRTEEAIGHYLVALRIRPDSAKAHNNLGNALVELGRIEEAIKHYLEALRIRPGLVTAHKNLGVALFRNGNIEGAIDHYQRALRIRPGDATIKNNLNHLLMLRQQRK